MKTMSLRLTEGQAKKLALLKVEYGCSQNQLIRFAVAHFIERRLQIERDIPILGEMKRAKENGKK